MNPLTAEEWLSKGKEQIFVWKLTNGEERKGQKHHEETLSYFDKAIELANDNKEIKTQAWYHKGEKWIMLPDWNENYYYNEAIKCYDEALKFDKNYAPAWYAKGCVMEELGNNDEAIECYDKAIELDKENDQYRVSKADILFKTKKDKDAIDLLLKTNLDLLEKLSHLKNKGQFFDYLIQSDDFEDSFFRAIMEKNEIADSKTKNQYREIYLRSLLLISYLFVSGEDVAHYTTKSVAQKLLFGKSKFRLNL
ncbi:MAG: tetratricopeptide repeat protein, partial [Dysgonamonadaceae bacterium]|nr:tetratricopeptide repeat protein [Dysgonamonadaceae bacterium]